MKEQVYLQFSLHNHRWRCLDGCQIIFIIDRERMRLGEAENLDRQIGGEYGVIERIGIGVTYETFQKIISSSSVEFQAGADEAGLKPHHLAALRDFASRVQP